ncbi:MAG TPA: hypothetical protein VEL74_17050 [Thermoanaerobaculia bacterium]|nr:hypothetical protein [Thermoanaerobaculia bacterium]
MLLVKSLAVWLLILVLAIINGAFREAVLLPSLGRPLGLVLSGLLLSVCIIVVACFFVPRMARTERLRPLYLGLLWLGLTLGFEFGFGRLVQRRSWPELLEAYTFKDGNIWPIVLVVTFLAPLLAVWWAGKSREADGALVAKRD